MFHQHRYLFLTQVSPESHCQSRHPPCVLQLWREFRLLKKQPGRPSGHCFYSGTHRRRSIAYLTHRLHTIFRIRIFLNYGPGQKTLYIAKNKQIQNTDPIGWTIAAPGKRIFRQHAYNLVFVYANVPLQIESKAPPSDKVLHQKLAREQR